MFAHLIARTRYNAPVIHSAERARWLWSRLRGGFACALAAVLMPQHLHLLIAMLDYPNLPAARRKLARIVATFSRRFALGRLWQTLPPPRTYSGIDKLARDIRYLHLNPCRPTKIHGQRVHLVSDPLEWPWSTHRDVVGAVADPWVSASRLAKILRWDVDQFPARIHRYVSSDPHVRVEGTALPTPAPASDMSIFGLGRVAVAAAVATRSPRESIRKRGPARRLFVALARRLGFTNTAQLARACQVQPAAIRRMRDDCPREWLHAGAMCLADGRLLPLTDDGGWVAKVSGGQ